MTRLLTQAGCALTLALLAAATTPAHAVLTNFTMTGDITAVQTSSLGTNPFNVTTSDTVTLTGQYDDADTPGGTGTITFFGTANTFQLVIGDTTVTDADTFLIASLVLSAGTPTDFAYNWTNGWTLSDFSGLDFAINTDTNTFGVSGVFLPDTFVATPVPEPATAAALLTCALAAFVRRR